MTHNKNTKEDFT